MVLYIVGFLAVLSIVLKMPLKRSAVLFTFAKSSVDVLVVLYDDVDKAVGHM